MKEYWYFREKFKEYKISHTIEYNPPGQFENVNWLNGKKLNEEVNIKEDNGIHEKDDNKMSPINKLLSLTKNWKEAFSQKQKVELLL